MKSIFGALAMVIVLAIVGLIVVRQTRALSASRAVLPAPEASMSSAPPPTTRAAEQQVTREIDAAMRAASAARSSAGEQ